jgi:predicted nucleic acid-binding protein
MPRLVAIDTGPVVGLFSRDDVNHAAALQFFREFRDHGFITVPVITEVMHLLSFRVDAQLDFLRWLRQGALAVFDLTSPDWERIVFLTWKYADVPMDFGDSSLVAVCERVSTRFVATVDSDFNTYRVQDRHRFHNLFLDYTFQ